MTSSVSTMLNAIRFNGSPTQSFTVRLTLAVQDSGGTNPQTHVSDAAVTVQKAKKCGDGNRAGAEECDDGNIITGDGCSSVCKVENSGCIPHIVGQLGGFFSYDVAASGNRAYIPVSGGNPPVVVNIKNPLAPTLASSLPEYAHAVHVDGRYLYTADSYGLWIYDIANPATPLLVGNAAFQTDYVQHVTVDGTHAYVVGGYTTGVVIFDVSNPALPFWVSEDFSVDDPTTVDAQGAYLYSQSMVMAYGLGVFDISNPASPAEVTQLALGGHIMGLDVSGNYAYLVVGNQGLVIVDVSNPLLPVIVSTLPGIVTTLTYPVFLNGYLYLPRYGGVTVVDVRNPLLPVVAAPVETPGQSLSLWIEGAYAYVAGGSPGLVVLGDLPGLCVPTCGNIRIEYPEACDDGNWTDGDGCNATCTGP